MKSQKMTQRNNDAKLKQFVSEPLKDRSKVVTISVV